MATLTLPTELSDQLNKNSVAVRVFRALSDTAKKSYVTYVIGAKSVSERKCRAQHSIKMLLGQSSVQANNC